MKKTIPIALAIIILALALAGCAQQGGQNNNGGGTVDLSKIVETGDKVKVDYKGTFTNGEEFDSSLRSGRTPLEFEVGAGQMIKGFDEAVVGMRIGEEKTVTLPPEKAYGPLNTTKTQQIPLSDLANIPSDQLQVGKALQTDTGLIAEITAIDSQNVTVLINHPMAGKTLVFWIKIVSIEKAK